MKQKIVVKVSMNGQKSRTKALKIAVGNSGVESIALVGQEKNQIEVIGDSVDVAVLVKLLRKGVGPTDLISVVPVDENKNEVATEPPVVSWPCPYANSLPQLSYVRHNTYSFC